MVYSERLELALRAGARAIENNKRLHGAIYVMDPFNAPKEIPYLEAVQVLRDEADRIQTASTKYPGPGVTLNMRKADGTIVKVPAPPPEVAKFIIDVSAALENQVEFSAAPAEENKGGRIHGQTSID